MLKKLISVFGLSLVLFVGYQSLPLAHNSAIAETPENKVLVFNEKSHEIKIEEGQEFIINLNSNASTGYKWIESGEPDAEFLELVSSEYKKAAPKLIGGVPMVGVPGHEEWKFKALKKGETEVKLKYVRPWEKDHSSVKETIFKIEIL